MRGCFLLSAAIVGLGTLAAAGTAEAGGWKKGRGHYAPYYPAPVYVAVPQVRYYTPPPVYYAPPPQPVVVYPAPPVTYAPAYPAYYGQPGVSLGINLPLR